MNIIDINMGPEMLLSTNYLGAEATWLDWGFCGFPSKQILDITRENK
jgi:hypothetical protein